MGRPRRVELYEKCMLLKLLNLCTYCYSIKFDMESSNMFSLCGTHVLFWHHKLTAARHLQNVLGLGGLVLRWGHPVPYSGIPSDLHFQSLGPRMHSTADNHLGLSSSGRSERTLAVFTSSPLLAMHKSPRPCLCIHP